MKNKQQGDTIPLFSKTIERKCVACSKIQDRKNMIRILKENSTGALVLNPDNKTFGRSVYICKSKECLTKVMKKNKLSKILKANISENLIKEIESVLN